MNSKSFFNKIANYFLRGIFILAPVFFTILALYKLIGLVDNPIQDIFERYFGYRIYGLGLITVILIIIGIGYLGSILFFNTLLKKIEKVIFKIPFVKEIYKSFRDIFGAFVSDKKKFDKPVLVEVSNGIYRLGFITNEEVRDFSDLDLISVFFPLSYAFTGELLIVEKSKIAKIDKLNASEVMKYVISGGIIDKK